MGVPTAGAIVLVHFPFSDLSQTKLRPSVILADAGRDDWVLCQITSKSYGDAQAVRLTVGDFNTGSLRDVSYARPGKLFMVNRDLIEGEVAKLKDESLTRVIDAVVAMLRRTTA